MLRFRRYPQKDSSLLQFQRQIHDMLDVEIEEAESPFEDVFESVASEIADVGEIIDGWAAGI